MAQSRTGPYRQNSNSKPESETSDWPIVNHSLVNLDELAEYADLAAEILDDPIALRQLSDRVFELLHQDYHAQRRRRGEYLR